MDLHTFQLICFLFCQFGYSEPNCLVSCRYPGYCVRCEGKCHCSKMACSQVIGCMDNALDGKIKEGKRARKVAILLFKVFIKWLTLNQI